MRNTLIGVVVILVLGIGGYFGAQSFGLLGPAAPSDDDISVYLASKALDITEPGDLRIDDFSRYTEASVTGKTLNRTIQSLLDAAGLSADYLENRRGFVSRDLCGDDEAKRMMAHGVSFAYRIVSSDGQEIGSFTAGSDFCPA